MTAEIDVNDPHYRRMRLAAMLCEAAELEHSLTCQYLFAGFALKREMTEGLTAAELDKVRGWRSTIMLIARQEMEHLGYVNNVLTALGEAPHLVRPDFPLDPAFYETDIDSKLARFDFETLKRFLLFELPERMDHETLKTMTGYFPGLDFATIKTLGGLYTSIAKLLQLCEAEAKEKGETIFIGPKWAEAMTGGSNIENLRPGVDGQMSIYGMNLKPVLNLEDAIHAIKQVLEEGEGAPEHIEGSHFGRFLEIAAEYDRLLQDNPGFDPSRKVVDTPVSKVGYRGVQQKHGTVIEDPLTNKVSLAFDLAYNSMMLMLFRFFMATDEDEADAKAIEDSVFFPVMTVVIRPLGELLTELPAKPGGDGMAGPGFRFDRRIALLPHRTAAFKIIYANLMALNAALTEVAGQMPNQQLNDRIDFVTQNVWRIAQNFANATGIGGEAQ
ncbi:ferritin-like domain-containing protein [Roseisalinus antarcticus]|nr:ferritin-like domain-containing protein [Roseisalinus antarcticus]